MVECTQGGYDGRFDRGENTKENYEKRTPTNDWKTDLSLYKSKIAFREVMETPTLAALAIQEIEGRRLRERYRAKIKPIKYNIPDGKIVPSNEVLRRRGLGISYH
jgi:hypothetical protein